MATVYPDEDEIKFRCKKYKDVEDILNNKVECTICYNDLLNEIVSKKMIMVHRSYLFLCCYNCFYKLCEGQEYSCILCKSNNELLNCKKCKLNVCKRCVENHKIIPVSNGIIKKCFNCDPQALWKQRAQAANVLTIFTSQLDLPNGLLVNEVEREQIVRKYLVNESKIGQSSTTDKVKDRLCLDFILNTYKCTVTEKLSDFPKTDHIPFDKCINELIGNFEYILEKTCSTLENFKRIFNIGSKLSPGIISMIKTLLKSVGENDNIFTSSRNDMGNECKIIKNNENNELSTICKKKSNSKNKRNKINCIFSSTFNNEINHSIDPTTFKKRTAVLESIDGSVVLKKMNKNVTKKVLPDTEKDETVHTLNIFGDLSNISSDTGFLRTLSGRAENDDYSQKSVIDIDKDLQSSMLVPQIYSDFNSDKSDDSTITINDVINSCLITCKKHGIDYYREKCRENKIDIDDIEISDRFDELGNEENTEISEFSDKNDETVTINCSKNISPIRISPLSDDSDSDFNVTKKMGSNKWKLITSKKRTKTKKNFDLTYSSCSNYSDSECFEDITTKKRKRIRKFSTNNSNKENDEEFSNSITTTTTIPTKRRKNILKMKNKNELSELTKYALSEEISPTMQMEKSQQIDPPTPYEPCEKLVLDFDSETNEELKTVHPDLVKCLKPNEVGEVKFLWDSVFESLDLKKRQKKKGSVSFGRCMGESKMLQIITLVHSLLRYPEKGIKTVLIVTKHSTAENWCKEFQKWLNNVHEKTKLCVLNFSEAKTFESRKHMVDEWQKKNGVLITSSQSYSAVLHYKRINQFPTLLEALYDPGPGLTIWDEGRIY